MSDAKTRQEMSPRLLKVAERAKREPETRLLALAHLIDEEVLKERSTASGRRRPWAWMGSRRSSTGSVWRKTSGRCTRG